MTINETKKVMAYIAAAYPRYFANVTRESAVRQAIPWFDALGEYSAGAVMTGVKSYISADNSGFPPTPGQIVHYIHFTGRPADHSGTEAWALVRRAVNCPWDQMEASFMTLPETVRKAVGNAASLKELAMMDSQKFEAVAQSKFLRMYDAVRKREATEQKIPAAAIAVRERLETELETRRRNTFGIPQKEACAGIPDNSAGGNARSGADKGHSVPAPDDMMERLRRRLK